MKNNTLIMQENILPYLDNYLDEIHKIKLFNQEEYNNKYKDDQTWPGYRSANLHLENKFLSFLILQNVTKVFSINNYSINLYVHLRTKEESTKDWVHVDSPIDYSFLIYLNESNLNSGTCLYDDNKNMIADIKYVKNRFVLFNGSYNHMGYGHFGENSVNGRLTINGFMRKV
jgi:hypothetical protein